MYITKFLLNVFFLLFTITGANEIRSLTELNNELNNGIKTEIGFLSEGNYHSVQNELSNLVTPRYYDNSEDLHDAVESGEVLAGLTSGTPDITRDINVFGSEQISVRAMLVKKNNDILLNALDAAIVRVIEVGGVEECARNNTPYQALVTHSCKPDNSIYRYPEKSLVQSSLVNGNTVKIAALGPFNWGGPDGDYTVPKPYPGFWPCYTRLIEKEFIKEYNITFERVWNTTSTAVLNNINNDVADVTEPYMTIGAAHNNTSRKTAFDLTCITSATQDKYFSKKYIISSSDNDNNNGWIFMIGFLSLFAFALIVVVAVMVRKEVTGDPLFKPLVTVQDDNSINKV